MNNLFQNKVGSFFRNLDNDAIVKKAESKYKEKTYLESNKQKYTFTQVFLKIFQLLSIVFALAFVIKKITMPIIPFQIPVLTETMAFILALFLLGLLEFLKEMVIEPIAENYVKAKFSPNNYKIPAWLVPISLVLTAFSVFASVEGASLFVEIQNDKTIAITGQTDSIKQAIDVTFGEKIKVKEAIILSLEERQVKRKWGLTKEESKSLEIATAEKNRLIKERDGQKIEKESKASKELTENASDTGEKSLYMLIVSIVNEILCLFCLVYGGIYLGFVYIEKESVPVQTSLVQTTPVQTSPVEIPQKKIITNVGFTATWQNNSFDKYCPNCGKPITQGRLDKVFCCDGCRTNYNRFNKKFI